MEFILNYFQNGNHCIFIKKFTLLSIFLIPFFINPIASQNEVPLSAIQVNSEKNLVQSKKKKGLSNYFKKDYPSPKKAVTLAIIPGLGQIYNKKFWKLPLVYGLLGGVVYAIDFNTRNYNLAIQSIEAKSGIIPVENDPFPSTPLSAVQARRNSFDKNRQLSWIGLIGFYLISAGDAFVDAHLKDFNVDDDISLRPTFQTGFNNQPTLGVSVVFHISN